MSGVITIGVGSTGCHVNRAFYDQIGDEHAIGNKDGAPIEGANSLVEERRSVYFEERENGGSHFHQARTIFLDTDPLMVEQATQHTTTFFDSSACHSSTGGLKGVASDIGAHNQMLDAAQDSIRKKIEGCDSLKGVRIFASTGGGTGSGATRALLEDERSSDWASKSYLFSIAPDTASMKPNLAWSSTQNTLLATTSAADNSRGVVWYDWKAVADISNRNNVVMSMCPPILPVLASSGYSSHRSSLEKSSPRKGNASGGLDIEGLEAMMMDKLQPGLEQLLAFNAQKELIDAYMAKAKERFLADIAEQEAAAAAEDAAELGEDGDGDDLDSDDYDDDDDGEYSDTDSYKMELEAEMNEHLEKVMLEARARYIADGSEIDTIWDPDATMKLIKADYDEGITNPIRWLGRYLKAVKKEKVDKTEAIKLAEDKMIVASLIGLSAASLTAVERFRCERFSSFDVFQRMQPVTNHNFFVPGLLSLNEHPETLDDLCMNTDSMLCEVDPANGRYAGYFAMYQGASANGLMANETLRKAYGYNTSKEHFLRWSAAPVRTEICKAHLPRGDGVISTLAVTSAMDQRLESMVEDFTSNLEKGLKYCVPTLAEGATSSSSCNISHDDVNSLAERVRSHYLGNRV